MGMSANGGPTVTPQVNMTPLVDVALVVLILFIIVTPLLTKTFSLQVPEAPEADARPAAAESDPPLVLTLDREGTVRVNQEPLERAALAERLPRMLAAAHHKVLYFDASDGVSYGAAVEVMDLARAGGARSIAILTQKVAP